MGKSNLIVLPSRNELNARKSWVAYIRIVLLAILLLLVAVPLSWSLHWIAGLFVLAGSALFIGYHILHLRSYELYFDDEGIWIYSGVFPWQRGVHGIKWRDVDGAYWRPTFLSWLFKSYSLGVKHRFEAYGGIHMDHVARGNEAVMKINARHGELIGDA